MNVSLLGSHFALEDGAVLTSDPAPLMSGERLCAVYGRAQSDDAQVWITKKLAEKSYELEGRTEDGSFIALTNLWIEPKLNVFVEFEQGGAYVVYQIVETDLES